MKPDSTHDRQELSTADQAIEWLVRLQSGRAEADDHVAYAAWRASSTECEAAAREAELVWQQLSATRHALHFRNRVLTTRPWQYRWAGTFAAAASVAIIAAVAMFWTNTADYSTASGERQHVVLADGSVVHLNTATSLSVTYQADSRQLNLHRGQALFEVAHDPQRPFIVRAGNSEVRAIGTVFQVEYLAGDVDVVVSEGLVEIKAPAQAEAPLRLGAGQAAGYAGKGVLAPSSIDPAVATAWQRGKLIFNHRPLGEVIRELERYSPGLILLANEQIAGLEVTGVFELDDIHTTLDMITRTLPVQVIRLPYLTLLR